MLVRRCYAAILVMLLISMASGSPVAESQMSSDKSLENNISQNEKYENNPMYDTDYQKNQNIVRRITGKMSDSRKMGIGALLVILGSVLYAGFNWNEKEPL